jgi:tetratricopeptide (TPR) repeat protein
MEMDQLLQRLGVSPAERLAKLEAGMELVNQRDDMSVAIAELYSQNGAPEKALEILTARKFHAWEGGEGGAAGQYALANSLMMQSAAEAGNLQLAFEHLHAIENPPDNLGIDHGLSLYQALAWFEAAEMTANSGDQEAANCYYQKVVEIEKRALFWGASTSLSYYAALALRALGHESEANEKLRDLQEFAEKKLNSEEEGGFYTSKPAMVAFDDDPKVESQIQGLYLLGLVHLAHGNLEEASANFDSVLKIDAHNWWAQQALSSTGDSLG